MNKYYLIYGWDLKNKLIMKPTIKEVNINDEWILKLPKYQNYKLSKCFCSLDKKEVEDMLQKTWIPFSKVNLWYDTKTILNLEELCRLQEERINSQWITDIWPEEELPF